MSSPPRAAARSILVLGGGSDIASAIVARLAGESLARVVLAARNPAAATRLVTAALAQRTSSTSDPTIIAYEWDALDVASHDSSLRAIFAQYGPFELVLCAVGMLGHHAGRGMAAVEVDLMIRTNFSGPAAALSVVGGLLAEQSEPSTIVVLSSVAAARARKSNFAYGASKAGLDVFTQGLGDALKSSQVRVIVVRPGFVRSKMTTGLQPAPMASTPEAVAEAVARSWQRSSEIVWVPTKLGPLMFALRNAPRSVWRRVADDR